MPVIRAGVRFTSRAGRVADDRAAPDTPSATPRETLSVTERWIFCDRADSGTIAGAIASTNNPHRTTYLPRSR
jgi:hypothetical protein